MDLPIETWEKIRDNIADVSCWFMGFEAAKGNDQNYRRPPGLLDLENTASDLNRKILENKK